MKILIGVFIALIICLIVLFIINSNSKILLYFKRIVLLLLVIDAIMIGYFMTKTKKYEDYYKEYEKLKSKDEWKDSQDIIDMSKVVKEVIGENGKSKLIFFADNKDAQEKMYEKCYDYTKKYYTDVSGNFDPKNTTLKDNNGQIIENKKFDYYGPTIECSNLAKTKQNKATDMLNKAHDKCINALGKNTAKYKEHMKNTMDPTYVNKIRNENDSTYKNKPDKEILYENCDEIMKRP